MTLEKDIDTFLKATGYIIVGASTRPNSAGKVLADRFLASFPGNTYLVNPRGGELNGEPLYKSIDEIPAEAEAQAAVLVVAAKYTLDSVKALIARGVTHFIVISGGFAEAGPEGVEYQNQLVELVEEHGITIIGPNTVGVYSPKYGVDTVFLPEDKLDRPPDGKVAFFSQSGALVACLMNHPTIQATGVSKILSLGNSCDVSEVNALQYLEEDDDTEVILAYLEGFHHGPEFFKQLRHLTKVKPFVCIKSNRTAAGAQASASHSASVAANDAVCDYLLKVSGAVRCDSWTELFDTTDAMLYQPIPKGKNIAIVTNGGGIGVCCTDQLDLSGLNLAKLDITAQEYIDYKKTIPHHYICPEQGPVDLTGSCNVDDYVGALDMVLKNPGVDGVILICLTCVPNIDPHEFVEKISTQFKGNEKPIVTVCLGGKTDHIVFEGLSKEGMPVYESEERSVKAMMRMCQYGEYLQLEEKLAKEGETEIVLPPKNDAIQAILDNAKEEGRTSLLEPEAAEVFRQMGIPTAPSKFVQTADEAVSAWKELGGEGTKVVMKLVSPQVIHKTDEGAVFVGLKTEEEIRETAEHLINKFKDRDFRGLLVNSFVPQGMEMLVGAVFPLEPFGNQVLVSVGGTFVEVLPDNGRFAMAPCTRADARRMIDELPYQQILNGYRGAPAADRDGLSDIITKVSFLAEYPEIKEVDINPIIFYEGGYCAVDARIIL
ncbi:hypothetical protein PCE1_002206 [Barthelona sp. PCE]